MLLGRDGDVLASTFDGDDERAREVGAAAAAALEAAARVRESGAAG